MSQCTASSVCGATSTVIIERVGAWDLQALSEHADSVADEDDPLAHGYCRFGLKGLLLGHVVVNELIQRAPRMAAAQLKGNASSLATAPVDSTKSDPANLTMRATPAAVDESTILPKVVAVLDLNGMGTGHLAAVFCTLALPPFFAVNNFVLSQMHSSSPQGSSSFFIPRSSSYASLCFAFLFLYFLPN